MRAETDDYVDASLSRFEALLEHTLATVGRGRDKLRQLSDTALQQEFPDPDGEVGMPTAPPGELLPSDMTLPDVDLIDAPSRNDLPRLRQDERFRVVSTPGNRSIMLLPNVISEGGSPEAADNDGKPLARNPLRDLRVRQALSLGIEGAGLAISVAPSRHRVFTIRAMAELPNGVTFERRSGLRITGDARQPVTWIGWRPGG